MKYNQRELKRFFEGELTKEEAKSIFDWINSAEGEKGMAAIVEEVWEKEARDIQPKPTKSSGNRNQLATNPDPLNPKPLPKKPKQIRIWFGVAAAVTLLITFGFALFSTTVPTKEVNTISTVEHLPVYKVTERGQRKVITLPDGSKVTLNAGSKIEYGQDFATNRTVHLIGEAFFEVVKDPKHPFLVVSQNLNTTALGTSFNIKAYGDTSPIQVSLATGKIMVENNLAHSQHIVVEPGEAVRFDPRSNSLKKSKVNLKGALSWQEGVLNFEKVPFQEILNELERWYGVEFVVMGRATIPMLTCSGTFGPNEYLSNVLEALSHSVDFDYQIKDKIVMLDLNKKMPMKHTKTPS